MNKKERKKENKDLERVPFVTVRQTDRNINTSSCRLPTCRHWLSVSDERELEV